LDTDEKDFCLQIKNLKSIVNVIKSQLALTTMEKLALLARLEAKPGKEQEVSDFLKSALPLAEQENDTIRWYAFQIGPSTFGIFDTFSDEDGRRAHLNGEIAKALMAKASELLASAPVIEQVTLLAIK
jgi:quinol monooxygenase YgiN